MFYRCDISFHRNSSYYWKKKINKLLLLEKKINELLFSTGWSI